MDVNGTIVKSRDAILRGSAVETSLTGGRNKLHETPTQ